MPTIVFLSPKGGAGKSTSALVLATQLAKGSKVAILDADPAKSISETWANNEPVKDGIDIVGGVNENTITAEITKAAENHDFVIVDLEGTAGLVAVRAVMNANYVIIPTQGSLLDAKQGVLATSVIVDYEISAHRHKPNFKLPYKFLLTRTSPAVRSQTLTDIRKDLASSECLFDVELLELDAYKSMFTKQSTLESLAKVNPKKINKAISNAESFTVEVLQWISDNSGETV